MSQSPGLLLTILAFALVIGPLIFLHELGHYFAGRWFGVKIDAFSIGFGNEVFGWTDKRGTRWKFSAMPLGGYVKFAGDLNPASVPDPAWLELPPEERARSLQARPVWQRAIIVAAGPVANFIVAVVILAGFAISYGDPSGPAIAGGIIPGSAAASAKLQVGDRVVAFDGQPVASFDDMIGYVAPRPDQDIRVAFVRDGAQQSVLLRSGSQTLTDVKGKPVRFGMIGIRRPTVSILAAPIVGIRRTGEIVVMMVDGLGQIITGAQPVSQLGGPLRIAQVSGQQMEQGPSAMFYLIALISINLGFINLLPVPLLDGGHLFFYAIEAIRRKPVSPDVQEWAFRGGLAAILALMVTVTFNDLDAFGLWTTLRGLIG